MRIQIAAPEGAVQGALGLNSDETRPTRVQTTWSTHRRSSSAADTVQEVESNFDETAAVPMTRHARTRCQQRCIPQLVIDLLLQFGTREKAGVGCWKLFLDKAARRRIDAYAGPVASLLSKHLDVYLVLGTDDHVVTVAPRTQRIHRH